jgi:hypothetical protein
MAEGDTMEMYWQWRGKARHKTTEEEYGLWRRWRVWPERVEGCGMGFWTMAWRGVSSWLLGRRLMVHAGWSLAFWAGIWDDLEDWESESMPESWSLGVLGVLGVLGFVRGLIMLYGTPAKGEYKAP